MTTFDDRERSYEAKFAHDAELRFKAEARRNRLLGEWAAGILGKKGDDARAYAARLILAGVPVEYREERQMIHAWLRARFMSEGAKAGFAALCDAVRRMANP